MWQSGMFLFNSRRIGGKSSNSCGRLFLGGSVTWFCKFKLVVLRGCGIRDVVVIGELGFRVLRFSLYRLHINPRSHQLGLLFDSMWLKNSLDCIPCTLICQIWNIPLQELAYWWTSCGRLLLYYDEVLQKVVMLRGRGICDVVVMELLHVVIFLSFL